MARYFDEAQWTEELTKPDWYVYMAKENVRMRKLAKDRPNDAVTIKEEFKQFLADRLKAGEVVLAKTGADQDAERLPIDAVVIHHSASVTPYPIELLNVTHLLNLYATHYADPEKELIGQPIWSGHVRDGQQVFYAYQWLVRRDGSVERLLEDNEIGWQAGDWEINRRSVAICLDNDYSKTAPSEDELDAVAALINEHYPQVGAEGVVGHREVNPKTTCPGNLFIGGWKNQLVERLDN